MSAPTRILIADDHPLVREGLKRLIDREPDFELAGEAASGPDVIDGCRADSVDVVLLDITMPGAGFVEVLSQLRDLQPSPATLILSMHPEEKFAVRALRAGASGYLTKGQSPRVIVQAIRKVAGGGTYVSPLLAESLVAGLKGGSPGDLDRLSQREYQVLARLGAGRTLAEIGVELGVSPKTVATYKHRVLEKLGLQRTADLIRYAVEHDVVD